MTTADRDLGRLEGKVDQLIDWAREDRVAREALDARVRKVENKQHWYSGISAAIGALLGIGASHNMKF